jgi:hypothetical protein
MFSQAMMIRPDNAEPERIISIALTTAPHYALRNVMSATGSWTAELPSRRSQLAWSRRCGHMH